MIWIWIGFIAFVLLMLALDLGVFHRKAHVITIKEAVTWSGVWITLGLTFSVFLYFAYENQWLGLGTTIDAVDGQLNDGSTAVEKYLTGYIVEKSLSVDNIFVISMVFSFFAVPPLYQHRVLFWGILGALLLRGAMIALGSRLIAEFHWILYLFAVFLIVTAVKMLFFKTEQTDPNKNIVVRLVRRLFPVTAKFHGQHFIVRSGEAASYETETPGAAVVQDDVLETVRPGTLLLTPLALTLAMVETTDLIFAVDSIPAIFAITGDPFLVFTSNVFAILGLRSLYFALAGMVQKFQYLKVSLALVLLVVGVKMLLAEWLKLALGKHFNLYLLIVVLSILAAGVVASIIAERRQKNHLKAIGDKPKSIAPNRGRISPDEGIMVFNREQPIPSPVTTDLDAVKLAAARSFIWHGALMIFLGLASGFITTFALSSRATFDAHIIALLQGAVLLGLAGAWHLLDASPRMFRVIKYTLLISFYANWLGAQLGDLWTSVRHLYIPEHSEDMPGGMLPWINQTVTILFLISMLILLPIILLLWSSWKKPDK